jgi:hypothetical protein
MLDPSNWSPEQNTKAFLMLMGGLEADHSFRTFNDKEHGPKRQLVRNFTGTFANCAEQLRELNRRGAGVFAVINKGGHRDADIDSITAVFADTDGAPLDPILEALPPHCVVSTSPGKYHVYWLVIDFPLDKFKATQLQIAKKFSCDPSINNLSRVMRIPGFKHQKADPFDVRIEQINAKLDRYTCSEIAAAFALKPAAPALPTQPQERHVRTSLLKALRSNPYSLSDAEDMLRFIEPWERDTWVKVIFALAHEYGETARDLAVRWSRGDLWTDRGRT